MPNVTIATLCVAVSLAVATPAAAQLNVSSPISIRGSTGRQDIAYDPAHDAYLYVGDVGPLSAAPVTGGMFIDAATRVTAAPLLLQTDGYQTLCIRAVYSPDVSDGAGGFGGFVVMWFEQPAPPGIIGIGGSMQVQIVAYPGRLVGPRRTVMNAPLFQVSMVSGAYSSVDHEFLFSWVDSLNHVTPFVRLDLNTQPVGPVTSISPPNPISCSFASFAPDCFDLTTVWNPVTSEFGVLYRDGNNLTMARVGGSGTVLQRTVLVNGNFRSAMDISLASGNYIVGWSSVGTPLDQSTNVAEVNGGGSVLRTTTISGIASNGHGISVSYSPISHTFLLVGSPYVAELDYHGAPNGPRSGSAFEALPRIAPSQSAPEWVVAAGSSVQFVVTSAFSCGTPDPFTPLGGGTCFNGGWYPPTVTPAPPPPPPTPGGCVTPDPFTAFGSGTCVNGGWYPPGAGGHTPPPPPPPGPGGCTTPDPFVAFGGGVCFNGGWYFRG